MDRADPGPARRAGGGARRRDVPDVRRRRAPRRVRRHRAALPRQRPEAAAARAGRLRPGRVPARPDGEARAGLRPVGGAAGGRVGRADVSHLDAPQPAHAVRARADGGRRRGRVGGRAGGPVAARRPLLHRLRGRSRAAHLDRRRRAAGPLRGRLADARDQAGGRARRAARHAGADDRVGRRGRHRRGDPRPPRDRRRAAGAGRPHRLPARRCRGCATSSRSAPRRAR